MHCSSQTCLDGILARGIIPGGLKTDRGDVYLSQSLPAADGTLPDRFGKRGTDVYIQLDAAMLAKAFKLYVSAAGLSWYHMPSTPYTYFGLFCSRSRATLFSLVQT